MIKYHILIKIMADFARAEELWRQKSRIMATRVFHL